MRQSLHSEQHWFIAIGASGSQGFQDIDLLLSKLPLLSNATVLVVLHRRSDQVSMLAQAIGRHASMPVLVAVDGERFERGVCYVGEPGDHLALAARSMGQLIADRFKGQHRNRTVDLLFSSVALHAEGRAIGVVLSGALGDGSSGLAAIHHAGGLTMVLTPTDSAETSGMPSNAISYDGPIDLTGSVIQIADAIVRIVSTKRPIVAAPEHIP